jgi:hypothetical protein
MPKIIRPDSSQSSPPALSGDARSIAARSLQLKLQRKPQRSGGGWWILALLCLGALGAFAFQQSRPAKPKPPVAEMPAQADPAPVDPVAQVAAPDPLEAPLPQVADIEPEAPMAGPVAPSEPRKKHRRGEAPGQAAVAPPEEAGLAAEPPLLLTGPDCQRQGAVDHDRDLLLRVINQKSWQAYQGLLERSINASLKEVAGGDSPRRFDAVWRAPILHRAFLRWTLISRISPAAIAAQVADGARTEFLVWLWGRTDVIEELLVTMEPQDDGAKVLDFLVAAWSADTEKFEKYRALAIACAVVFDRPMAIPNPLGGYGSDGRVDPLQRYRWYIEKNEKGKLAAPVDRSEARDLVWVVCAPVANSELEWAVDKMKLSRRNWGGAYGMVQYLMERAVDGLNPYKEYSFEEILKEGGVCADQSYFCVNTARALGIPGMILGGETDLGGHAWAGLKLDADEWSTTTGRIGGVSKGQAENPQTGGSITEQEILHWNQRHQRSPAAIAGVWRHLWLADFFAHTNRDAECAQLIHLVNQIGPSFPESWRALYGLLEAQTTLAGEPPKPVNLAEWQDFAKRMRREFKDNPRMAQLAADAEMEYVFPYTDAGAAERSLIVERRRIERMSPEQKDLIAESLKRQADLIEQRGEANALTEVSQLYDRAMRDYGGSITGFKMMSSDYFARMLKDPELARKAARDIELAFKRVVETGTKDWFRAETESEIYRAICGYYRTAGDEDRAALLEKRIDTLMKRARRSAY